MTTTNNDDQSKINSSSSPSPLPSTSSSASRSSSSSSTKEKKNPWNETITVLVVSVLIALLLRLLIFNVMGVSFVIIENGPNSSMEPTYYKGDLFVLTKPDPSEFQVGDIIVYKGLNALIIHRIVDITTVKGTTYFRVSGDNPLTNSNLDISPKPEIGPHWIPYDLVVGKVHFFIPRIGYLSLWLSGNGSPLGTILYVLLVLVLVLAIIWPEDENKEKNKSKTKKSAIKLYSQRVIQWYRRLSRQKQAMYAIGLLLLVLLLPIALDYLNYHPDMKTEMKEVRMLTFEKTGDGDYVLFATFEFTQDGSWRYVIQNVEVHLIQNGTVIGTFIWNSFYEMEGDFTVGATITVSPDQVLLGQPAQLQAVAHVTDKLGSDFLSTATYTITALNA